MKQLVVSVKTPGDALGDFRSALRKARKGTLAPVSEVVFDNRRDFERFVQNLHVLSNIRALKPRSVYELAKRSGYDVSNLNKIILFFEEMGVIRIREGKVAGRKVRRPEVGYDRIEFRLNSGPHIR